MALRKVFTDLKSIYTEIFKEPRELATENAENSSPTDSGTCVPEEGAGQYGGGI